MKAKVTRSEIMKVTGCLQAKKIFLYMPLIKWYLQYCLRLTAVYHEVIYEPGKPFSRFPEEVANPL